VLLQQVEKLLERMVGVPDGVDIDQRSSQL
jgi:hypothetical protein